MDAMAEIMPKKFDELSTVKPPLASSAIGVSAEDIEVPSIIIASAKDIEVPSVIEEDEVRTTPVW